MLDYLKKLVLNWNFFNLVVIVLFALLGSLPFFKPGLYTAHDIWHQVARHYQYSQALSHGQIFPAWITTMANGYGYPLFIFSYHLPWMLGSVFTLGGMTIYTSIKTLFVFAFLTSGLTMYFFTSRFFNSKLSGLIAAIVYMWAPYHFLTNYVSAAIGTAFIFTLIPIIFLGIDFLFKKPTKGVAFMALGLAGIILSHLISFALLMPFVALFFVGLVTINEFNHTKIKLAAAKIGFFMGAIILSVFLSAFYLIPLVKFMPLIQATTSDAGFAQIYVGNFVNFKQLLYSPWGFGPIISNAKDGEISFQVGIAQWLGLGLSLGVSLLYLLRKFWNAHFWLNTKFLKQESGFKLFLLSAFCFLLSTFLMVDSSQPLWDFGNEIVSLDYPFRLLVVTVFFGSLIVGWLMKAIKVPLIKYPLFVFLVFIAFYTNRNHVRVNQYTDVPLDLYIRSEKTTNTFNEYLPSKASSSLINDEKTTLIVPPTIESQLNHYTTKELSLTFIASDSATVSFHQYAFPGQTLYLNGQKTEYTTDGMGLISAVVQPGEFEAVIRYEKPAVFRLGLTFSIIALLITLFLLINKYNLIHES